MNDSLVGDFLHRAGLGSPVRMEPLTGGVSSDIWRVDLPGASICVKRALPRLRVAQLWEAPVERNGFEWAWFEAVAGICPEAWAALEEAGLIISGYTGKCQRAAASRYDRLLARK